MSTWLYQPVLPAAAEIEAVLPTLTTAYWVGGANWTPTDANPWASTSGGPGGAGLVDATTNVIFDANSGLDVYILAPSPGYISCKNLTVTADSTLSSINGTGYPIYIYGYVDIQLSSISISSSSLILKSTSNEILRLPSTFSYCAVSIESIGTYTLQNNLTLGPNSSSSYPFIVGGGGTLNLNNKILSTPKFTAYSGAVDFGTSGEIQLTSIVNNTQVWLNNAAITGTSKVTILGGLAGQTLTIDNSGASVSPVNFIVQSSGICQFGSSGGATQIIGDFTRTSGSIVFYTAHLYGNFSSTTFTANTALTFKGSGTKSISAFTMSGAAPITFDGVGGTWNIAGNMTAYSSSGMVFTNGTVNLSSYTITTKTYTLGAGTKTLSLGSGILEASGDSIDFSNNSAGLTLVPGTSTIVMSSGSATSTFNGGGLTYYNLKTQKSFGTLVVQSSNTFNDIQNSAASAQTISFTPGTTQTVSNFTASGTSGKVLTLQSSTSGSPATLSKSSGIVNVSYCTIKDLVATGGAIWNSFTSNTNTDNGGNTGWVFTAIVAAATAFFLMF